MRAVVFGGVREVRVADVPDAVVEEPADAVVRVTRTAICGSDLHFFHGKAPIEPGDVLGHEAVGVVEAVGPNVDRFSPGDRVVVAFNIACGACWFCLRGEHQLCDDFRNLGAGAFGGNLAGAQATYVRVPVADVNLLHVPDDMDDERALFVGDVLTTGVFAASIAEIEPGSTVAVVGCGPVGFFCVQAARAFGAGRVFAVDMEPGRLALAAGVGAEPVNVRERHPASALAEATDGRGADVVIEAVGTPAAFESAVGMVRRGGRVVVVGVYAGESVELQLGCLLGAGADAALLRHLPGPRVVGASDGRAGRRADRSVPADLAPAAARGRGRGLRVVRPTAGDEGRVAAVTVVYRGEEPSGLASMVGGLIDQNLERDPSRLRLLRPSSATITVPDAGVAITVRTGPGEVEIRDGVDPGAQLAITADSERLLSLTSAPLRFGLPDVFDARGRAVLRDVVSGRVRIRGMVAHPRRLARLSSLLSVA